MIPGPALLLDDQHPIPLIALSLVGRDAIGIVEGNNPRQTALPAGRGFVIELPWLVPGPNSLLTAIGIKPHAVGSLQCPDDSLHPVEDSLVSVVAKAHDAITDHRPILGIALGLSDGLVEKNSGLVVSADDLVPTV